MQKSILTIALIGLFTTANAATWDETLAARKTEFQKNQDAITQRNIEAQKQQQIPTTLCTSIMCSTSTPGYYNADREAAMIANRADSLKNTTNATASTVQKIQTQYSTPSSSSTPKTTVAANKVATKSQKIRISEQVDTINKQQTGQATNANPNTNINAAYGQQTAQTAQQEGGLGLGRIMSGDISAALNVASVIAQETGDEKTAKYLLGAGGLVGAGDVAQEIMSGNANIATAIKGVASAGAIYAATSGNEQKVRDFGRGAAILEGVGAYAGGDGVFAGTGTTQTAQTGSSQEGCWTTGTCVPNKKQTGTNTTASASSSTAGIYARAQQAAQKQVDKRATSINTNCIMTMNIAAGGCATSSSVSSSQTATTINAPVISSVPILR